MYTFERHSIESVPIQIHRIVLTAHSNVDNFVQKQMFALNSSHAFTINLDPHHICYIFFLIKLFCLQNSKQIDVIHLLMKTHVRIMKAVDFKTYVHIANIFLFIVFWIYRLQSNFNAYYLRLFLAVIIECCIVPSC